MTIQVILRGEKGALEGHEFTFVGQDQVVIGRAPQCSLRLDEPGMSPQHCLLRIDAEGVWVRDLGSLSGTFVNGQNIGRHFRQAESRRWGVRELKELQDGDELRLAGNAFRIGVSVTDLSQIELASRLEEPALRCVAA